MHAHGEVVDHADVHPGQVRRALGGLELLVQQPLHPHVEVDPVGQPGPRLHRVRGVGARRGVVPLGGVLAELLPQRAPQAEVLQALPALGHEAAQLLLAVRGAADGEQQLEALQLGRVRLVPVDGAGVEVVLALDGGQRVDHLEVARAQVGVLGDLGDAQVEGVEEAAAGRQVRRGLHRRCGLGGVQRVDQQVVRPLLARDRGEAREVRGVAHAPRAPGGHRVDLRHVAPAVPAVQPVGAGEAPRGHGQRRRDRASAVDLGALGADLVPAHGEALGHLEGGLAGEDAVHVPRGAPVVDLGGGGPGAALRHEGHADGGAVRDVHGEAGALPRDGDDHGRQDPPPGRQLPLGEARLDRGVVPGVRAQRVEHGAQRRLRDLPLLSVEPGVGRGDPVGLGEPAQRAVGGGGVGHGPHSNHRRGRSRRLLMIRAATPGCGRRRRRSGTARPRRPPGRRRRRRRRRRSARSRPPRRARRRSPASPASAGSRRPSTR